MSLPEASRRPPLEPSEPVGVCADPLPWPEAGPSPIAGMLPYRILSRYVFSLQSRTTYGYQIFSSTFYMIETCAQSEFRLGTIKTHIRQFFQRFFSRFSREKWILSCSWCGASRWGRSSRLLLSLRWLLLGSWTWCCWCNICRTSWLTRSRRRRSHIRFHRSKGEPCGTGSTARCRRRSSSSSSRCLSKKMLVIDCWRTKRTYGSLRWCWFNDNKKTLLVYCVRIQSLRIFQDLARKDQLHWVNLIFILEIFVDDLFFDRSHLEQEEEEHRSIRNRRVVKPYRLR